MRLTWHRDPTVILLLYPLADAIWNGVLPWLSSAATFAPLEQHACDFDTPVLRRYIQRGFALVVLRSYIRSMLE